MSNHHQAEHWNDIGEDAVYAQLYNETRRFRDYQLAFAKWSVSLILAFAGGYLALTTHGFTPGIYTRLLLVCAVLSLSVGSVLVILHTNSRFDEIRRYVNSIQPGFMHFKPAHKRVKPHHVMIALLAVLSLVVCALIAIYPATR
jgi:hypothetical protein